MLSPEFLKHNHDKFNMYFRENAGKPFILGRFGCVENSIVQDFKNGKFSEDIRHVAAKHVGLSPPTDRVLRTFCEHYISALENSDLISLPHYGDEQGKETLMKKLQSVHCPKAVEIEYNILENPFYFSEYSGHWIHYLDGKRVLIVSPLSKSIERQLSKLDQVYAKISLMRPKWSTLITVQTPQTQTLSGSEQCKAMPDDHWINELNRLKEEITSLNDKFDIALLGCGGYAMPLCLHIKSIGKQAVMYGGALQLLFGILGQRWVNYTPITTDAWVRPLEEERPAIWREIEGGCYW